MSMQRFVALVFFFACSAVSWGQGRALPDFTDLVEKQGAAVVNISTTQHMRGQSQAFPFDESDPAFEFFRRFMPRLPGGGAPREFENKSLGSGFIISADGYILTNAHVVDAADEITVRLNDKREYKARIIGADRRTDVALLKIEASGLPATRLGDPAQLRVGEWVVAIGSPFGFDNSVTAGIVSAKGRALPQENYVPFIQTDVAINPGNSGGPLFNMRGEVVGINSQIYSRSGGYMGVSFAIPIDVAMEVQGQLRAHGKVSRGRLGVVIQELTRDLAESLNLGKANGAVVNQVEKGSPADKAGLAAGDVILRFEGKPVGGSADLQRLVGSTRPGSRVTLQVWQRGQVRELPVVVGEAAEDKVATRPARGNKSETMAANRLGLVLSEPGQDPRKEGRATGLLVEEVRGAGRGEVRPGDIILAVVVRGTPTEVKTVEQFNRLLGQMDKGAPVTLLLRRGEMQTFVTLRGAGANANGGTGSAGGASGGN